MGCERFLLGRRWHSESAIAKSLWSGQRAKDDQIVKGGENVIRRTKIATQS